MPAPVAIAASYLAINLAILVWLERRDHRGHPTEPWMVAAARTLRYGPPLLGLAYLVTIAGDWPFFLFVLVFFATAAWLLDGLLNYPSRPRKRE